MLQRPYDGAVLDEVRHLRWAAAAVFAVAAMVRLQLQRLPVRLQLQRVLVTFSNAFAHQPPAATQSDVGAVAAVLLHRNCYRVHDINVHATGATC